ncbi:4-fold beta flower protein [Mesorhizobium argentiipisi]|uniref:4-fold beta flower protein n=1 Tax=Mesorhizobium argentiipisi TaxID=3015175 RepID=UPI0039F61B93
MIALFGRDCSPVAWLHDSGNIFDQDLKFVALVRGGNVFRAFDVAWLGPVDHTTLMDRTGLPVTFGNGYAPKSRLAPLEPVQPLKPLKPLQPLRPLPPPTPLVPLVPLGGWSALDFDEYLRS